ncbi:hypothetical protein BO70DRAFT_220761 [Aspergillus heteromorphus CBS 117.55]|uniref:Uncharacterized protein n=1 Tax=Aspergillus heteromorphus CBS 117.55 TaxID=1448321 RepID=A0A317WJ54_9EURO|nr:uncharacterized protein BO70DRAFT_220761 [Aspergillus heteromorphus CBS 117.55]PWY86085.1 hypothetical protein BO70DRAFT_220761 [Aspergillus heteromorphus CBS 117.55]
MWIYGYWVSTLGKTARICYGIRPTGWLGASLHCLYINCVYTLEFLFFIFLARTCCVRSAVGIYICEGQPGRGISRDTRADLVFLSLSLSLPPSLPMSHPSIQVICWL